MEALTKKLAKELQIPISEFNIRMFHAPIITQSMYFVLL